MIEGIKKMENDPEIESIRKRMQLDKTEITGADYGAGSHVSDKYGKTNISKIASYGISSAKDCRMLYEIVRMKKPSICVELGTSLGITTAYLSKALPDGEIYTFEGNTALCDIAERNWEGLKCNNIHLIQGNIDETLEQRLENLPYIDFAIIDANHTKSALLDYYKLISEKISPGGMIYIDDIRWSVDMYKGWKEIVMDPRITLSLEFLNNGLLFYETGLMKEHYVLSY